MTCRLRILAASVVLLLSDGGLARDLATMQPTEIQLLQQRLKDAACYAGPVDGLASPAVEAARQACPDQEPVLRIETGMHVATVNRVATDAACTVLATASDDRTVRLWSLPDGAPKQTLRLPIGGTKGGMAYAVGMSPDGRWLAAGGLDARADAHNGLYLYDLSSGGVRRLEGLDGIILHIAFSPDGAHVAAALGSGAGIRVFDVASGRLLMADKAYGRASYGLAFLPDGGLVTTNVDGFVRRYDAALKLAAKVRLPEADREPFTIAVAPDGRRLAVGYAESTAVVILDAATLKPVARAATGDVKPGGSLAAVAWLAGGDLVAAGRSALPGDAEGRMLLRRFGPDGRKTGSDVAMTSGTVDDLKPCGDGAVFGSADPAFGSIAAGGRVTLLGKPVTADMHGKVGDSFLVAPDGLSVRFGFNYQDDDMVLFDLAAGTLVPAPDAPPGLAAPDTTGLPVTRWQDDRAPRLGSRPIALTGNETAHALAIRPDRRGFVLAGSFMLYGLDAAGTRLWTAPSPASAWGANLARGGDLVVSAHDDGTIRWNRWSDGRELLALFVHRSDRRWVAWTPSGYYMASPGAEDLIGWHVNRGWAQAPDFFPASRFRERFARPDVVQRILVTLDEDKAVAEADAAAHRRPAAAKPIEAQLPPVIRITAPRDGTVAPGTSVTFDYTLRAPSGLPVEAIEVLVDGRPLSATRGLGRIDEANQAACPGLVTRGLGRVTAAPGEAACRLTVAVPAGAREVALVARAGTRASVPAALRLAAGGAAGAAERGRLIVLSVGVADYDDPSLRLGLPGKDALDMAEALARQKGGLYGEVLVKTLIDKAATRAEVLEGLDWIERQRPGPGDVTVVFMAGHGVTDEKGLFWFLPSDVRPASLAASAVSQDDLRRVLQALPSKAVLFLDACHSGGAAGAVSQGRRGAVDMNAVVNDLSTTENGVVTFASSMGRELSQENPAWGNGAFTTAVLEGIRDGKADMFGKGRITIAQLDAYVANRVADLTGQQQHAIMTRPPTIADFPIAQK